MLGFSKPRKIIVLFFLVLFIASLCFAFISIEGGAEWGNIGTWFPSVYFFTLLIITYSLDKIKKWLKKIYRPMIAVFYSGMILFLIAFGIFCVLIMGYASDDIPDDPDLVIVLGCQVYGYTPGTLLKYRLDATLDTLHKYPGAACITSGGQGPDETVPEAAAMKKYLTDRQIRHERIYEEAQSSSSFQNLIYSKKIIEENNLKHDNIIIITSEYHIPRAVLIAKRIYPESNIYAVKARSPFNMVGAGIVREFFAFVKSYIFDKT